MAVAFVTRTFNSASSTSVTVTVGTVADGNVVYAVCFTGGTGSAAITAPGGWTNLASGTISGDSARYALFRIVASSLPTTAAFASSDATFVAGYCMEFSGNDTTTPEDVAVATTGGTTSTFSWASVTTSTNNAMVCAVITGRSDAVTAGNMPTGYTAMGTDSLPATRGSYAIKATAGAETPTPPTTQAIGNWVSYTIAIRESGAGGGGVVGPLMQGHLVGGGILTKGRLVG